MRRHKSPSIKNVYFPLPYVYTIAMKSMGVVNLQVVWDMLSDKKIWSLLGDVDRRMDEDFVRLMLIELFSRLKIAEEENMALRVLLMEEELLDEKLYQITRRAVKDFLKEKDSQRARESDFFASSGVTFPQWVNFKLTGSFDGSKGMEA